MFFRDWAGVLRVIVVGTCAYVALVAMLRLSGKRTLAKMNAFDFVVTVALGSTLASIITSERVVLVEGVTALALLIALQVAAARVAVWWPAANAAVKSEPTLLVLRGRLLRESMRAQRISEDDVVSAVRREGFATMEDVEAVVLEASGDLSVVVRSRASSGRSGAPLLPDQ